MTSLSATLLIGCLFTFPYVTSLHIIQVLSERNNNLTPLFRIFLLLGLALQMSAKYISACLAIALVSMAAAQTAGQQGGAQQGTGLTQCQQTFVNSLYKCIGDQGLDTTSFLRMVTNNTTEQPQGNEMAFKKSACEQQQKVGTCMVTFMNQLINSTMCLPNAQSQQDQRPLIDRQFVSLITAYDMVCAHPCRKTLFADLRQCYAESHLDPDLFLSNSTMNRGAVIGNTKDEAHTFCKYKEELIKCMKTRRDECPESPKMLSLIGLDIDSMEQGVEVLCKHTDLYLVGIDCFAEQTKAIEKCMTKQMQDTMALMIDARNNNLSEPVVGKRFCEIRLDHIDCDLGGWRQKNHKSCTPAVIGLRTELECGLIPEGCDKDYKGVIEEICHVDNFNREGRAGADVAFISLSALPIPIILLMTKILG